MSINRWEQKSHIPTSGTQCACARESVSVRGVTLRRVVNTGSLCVSLCVHLSNNVAEHGNNIFDWVNKGSH